MAKDWTVTKYDGVRRRYEIDVPGLGWAVVVDTGCGYAWEARSIHTDETLCGAVNTRTGAKRQASMALKKAQEARAA